MARIKEPGSIRSYGKPAMVAIDRPTYSRLKRLAGDTPLFVKVRELVDMAEAQEGGGGGIPLPGQEVLTSRNTLASVSSRVDSLARSFLAFSERLDNNAFKTIFALSEALTSISDDDVRNAKLKPLIERDIIPAIDGLKVALLDKLSEEESTIQTKLVLEG